MPSNSMPSLSQVIWGTVCVRSVYMLSMGRNCFNCWLDFHQCQWDVCVHFQIVLTAFFWIINFFFHAGWAWIYSVAWWFEFLSKSLWIWVAVMQLWLQFACFSPPISIPHLYDFLTADHAAKWIKIDGIWARINCFFLQARYPFWRCCRAIFLHLANLGIVRMLCLPGFSSRLDLCYTACIQTHRRKPEAQKCQWIKPRASVVNNL